MILRNWRELNLNVLSGDNTYIHKLESTKGIFIYGSDAQLINGAIDDLVYSISQGVDGTMLWDIDLGTDNLHLLKAPQADLFSFNKKEFHVKIVTLQSINQLKNVINCLPKTSKQVVLVGVECKAAQIKKYQDLEDMWFVPFYEATPLVTIDQLEFLFKGEGKQVERSDISKLVMYVGDDYRSLRMDCEKLILYYHAKEHLTFEDMKVVINKGNKDVSGRFVRACIMGDVDRAIGLSNKLFIMPSVTDMLPLLRVLTGKFMQLFRFANLAKIHGTDLALVKAGVFFKEKQLMTEAYRIRTEANILKAIENLYLLEKSLKASSKVSLTTLFTRGVAKIAKNC